MRAIKESDYDDLFEYLSQLENDEFEGYPGITYESGKPIWKDTYVYAVTEGDQLKDNNPSDSTIRRYQHQKM